MYIHNWKDPNTEYILRICNRINEKKSVKHKDSLNIYVFIL